MKAHNDPANYRKMSIPFDSIEQANTALDAFYDDVKAAREKHKIPDVLAIVKINYLTSDGEGESVAASHFGSSLESEGMAAYAYGELANSRKESMANELLRKRR